MEWRAPTLCVLALALTCALQVNATKAKNHVNSVCSTWGKDHFKTFDGDVYQFPGMCEYSLASDCHTSFQEFSVHMQRTVVDGNSSVSRVVVTINDLVIDLTKSLAMVNSEVVKLPYHSAGVLVEKSTIYTKLYAKLGLSVMWNRHDAITLELDSKYANRTCGLCGDFNGIQIYDEFIHEGRKISPIEFGNKHKIHNPTVDCEDPYEEEEEPDSMNTCQEFLASCAQLLQSDAWQPCARVLSPAPYIQACAEDKCRGLPGDTQDGSSICATLAEYSRQCSHAGGTPPNWRTPIFCAVQCPFNMVYSESGSPCVDTCTNTDTSLLCEEHKMDGCFCPDGTVFDDISKTGCIAKEQCQCKHDKVYNSGEVLQKDNEECVCHQGMWSCKTLSTPGVCTVEEGSHITTYDGKAYTFHGDCYYVLSKDCASSKFSVLGQLAPCSTQEQDTCLKSVVVSLNKDRRNVLVFRADGKVIHNAEINLPYSTAELTIFRPSSFHVMLQTNFGLQLQIQLVPIMQVYITLDQSYKTKTCGLCGNFNMVLSDDLKTPQGLVEGTAASFGNSWKAQASCPDRAERLDDPCALSMDNENYAEHWCSLLKSKESAFAKCHRAVNPEIYYKRCKYSSCNCEKSEDCLCAVFSSYVRACSAKGVFLLGWRSAVCNKYTGHCPASQTFFYQLQDCQRTCRSLASERQGCSTDFLPVDGCSCPDGLYQDDRGVCVPMAKCPCYHNGEHVKPGKSINIKDEHCVCSNGKLHCKSWKTRSMGCPSPKVFFNCSTAGPDEHGLECAQTCMQLDDDCFPSECESGCQCPSGLLDDGRGHCAKQHDCPCQHDGHFYAAGTQLPVKCNTCTCKRGKWVCTDQKCPSTCSIYGSGHYNTFDEQRFGFNGDCGYVAVQNKCGNKTGDFRVITENVPCGTTGTTCSKSVRIYLGRVELKLSQGSYETLDLGVGPVIKYRVTNVGLYLVIESDIGLAVLWDRKTTVRIILQPQHKGEVCGLCGNFNGDGSDDFTTQGQLRVSSILEFANSWKVSSHCPDAEEDFDPCSARPNRHTWAQMQCSIIKGDTFKACHNKVDLQPYLDNCVKDSCACDSGGDCECFCTAVAAYAQACNEVGVCVAWRTPEICPVFCDYYNAPFECKWHYLPCHTPCYKTCLNPQGICSNPLPNLEGCYPICPEDKPIFDEESQTCVDICVPTTPTTTPTTTTTPTPTPEQSTTTKPVGTPTPPGTSTPPTPTTTPTTTTTTTPTTTPTPEQSTTTVVITSATPTPTTVTSSPTTVVTHSTTTPGKTPPPGSSTPSISITTPTITTTTKTTTATTTPTPEQSTTTAFTVATEPPHTIITSPQVIITTPATSSSITHFTTTTGETTPPGTSTPSTPTTTPTTTTTTPTTTPTPEQSTTTVVITSATPTPTTVTSSPTTVVTHSTTTTGKTPPPGSSTPSISITTPTITTTTKTTTATTTPTPEQSTTTAFTVATEPPHTIITSPQVIITTPATSSSITHFTTTTGETTPPGTSTPSTPTTTPTTTTTTPTTTPTPERSTTTVVITSSTPTPTTVTSSPTTVVTHSTTTTGETPTPPGTSTPSTPTTTPTTTTTTTPTPEQSTTTVVITSATPTPTTVTSSPTTVVTHSTTTTGQTPPPVPSTPSTPKTTPTTTPTTTTATTTTPVQSTTTETTRPTTVTASPTTVVTHSTTTPGESPTPPPHPECPEWDVAQNETFLLCNCTMARCIENNTIEIIPYECPPLENITCANGKKPVLVYDEYYCCQHYACDCYCEGWGDPHYITFDGLFYSFQGNCTYVLMEEIRPRYNFKIYIDNVHCDPREDVSCPRAIIVSYNSLVITLKNHNLIGAAKLEAIMDNNPLRLPFSRNGVKVINSGINMIVEIPTLGIVVSFGITGFSVNLPFKHFGNNTEGHCGTCNNNQADDCMLPNGQLVDSCAVMAEYWPAKDLYRPDCPVPQVLPTSSPVQPTEKPCTPNSVCNLIMGSPFDDCHRFVSPDPFFYGCVFDSCHMINPTVECTSLQTYAAACAQFGVCLYWRNHTTMCNSECPADKVYKPCGPVEQPTCDDNPDEPTMGLVTEGCFCPDGMKLFNKDSGVCVETCGCLDPEGVPREFGETFEYKCQDCTCMMDTKVVICKPKVCSNPGTVTCNEPGFIMVNETDPSDPCCSKLSCRCDSSTCPSIDMTCNVGYKPVVSVPEGKCCAEHTCEPKKVCVHKNMEYEPGTSIPVVACQECHCTLEVDPKTQLYKIQCEVVSCDEVCETGYMKLEANDECCAKCVQTHCAIQLNGTTQLLEHGSSWSPPGQKCMKYSCTLIGGSYVTTESNIQCPPFNESNCQTDTIQTASDGCCRVCIEKERACKVETKKRLITINGCQTHNEVEMPYCEGACNTFSKYSELAASMQHSCACCQETRSSNRTVSLRCLNGDFVDYTYTYVEECGCSQTDCQQTHMAKPGRRTRSIRLP